MFFKWFISIKCLIVYVLYTLNKSSFNSRQKLINPSSLLPISVMSLIIHDYYYVLSFSSTPLNVVVISLNISFFVTSSYGLALSMISLVNWMFDFTISRSRRSLAFFEFSYTINTQYLQDQDYWHEPQLNMLVPFWVLRICSHSWQVFDLRYLGTFTSGLYFLQELEEGRKQILVCLHEWT